MACYVRTHQQFNSPIALNLDFFERISARMADNILLIVALRDDTADRQRPQLRQPQRPLRPLLGHP
jgi:predicted N-acyltransferase